MVTVYLAFIHFMFGFSVLPRAFESKNKNLRLLVQFSLSMVVFGFLNEELGFEKRFLVCFVLLGFMLQITSNLVEPINGELDD